LLAVANADASMPEEAKATVKLLAAHLEGLDRSIEAAEDKIGAVNARNRTRQLLNQVPGVGR
jgi:transposase